jgi:hypothetical protein
MDREAAVIRAEMSQTRASLDQKIARLEERARELHPRRYMPDYMLDRAIGAVLTFIGTRLAWRQYSARFGRRARVRAALASYEHW